MWAIQFVVDNIPEPVALEGLDLLDNDRGIPGALLSVPITVCVMIISASLPDTRSLAMLMS